MKIFSCGSMHANMYCSPPCNIQCVTITRVLYCLQNNNSLYTAKPFITTSDIYLIINDWATSFGH